MRVRQLGRHTAARWRAAVWRPIWRTRTAASLREERGLVGFPVFFKGAPGHTLYQAPCPNAGLTTDVALRWTASATEQTTTSETERTFGSASACRGDREANIKWLPRYGWPRASRLKFYNWSHRGTERAPQKGRPRAYTEPQGGLSPLPAVAATSHTVLRRFPPLIL